MQLSADLPTQSRPTHIDVSLSAIQHNYLELKRLAPHSKVLAVLKANAYGHGLVEVAQCLEKVNADYFGVALVEEGVQLRHAGIHTPILVFGGLVGSQVEIYLKHNLELTASSMSKLNEIDAVAKKQGIQAKIHLKIDTGMARIGVRPESAPELLKHAQTLTHCSVRGIYSHFACADETDSSVTLSQLALFNSCVQDIFSPSIIKHIANSAASLAYPKSHLDMIRPGLALYGIASKHPTTSEISLKPALSLRSCVVYFKVVKKGAGVSYGHSWIAPRDSRVVTVPIGYGDGYPRCLSNVGQVLIRGRRYPVIGRICMDQLMVNIDQDEAYNGDEVVLIGPQGTDEISVNEVADWAHTVPHEILTNLNLRAPRRFLTS
jgi:alanine racemase